MSGLVAAEAADYGSLDAGVSALDSAQSAIGGGPSATDAGPSFLSMASGSTCHSRQKVVPVPRNLSELQQAAANHFNLNGRVRLYTVAGKEMFEPIKLTDLPHMTDIIVKSDRTERPFAAAGERMLSTKQADFVRHPNGLAAKPTMSDHSSSMQEEVPRFEGQSYYKTDYARPPAEVRPPRPVADSVVGSRILGHSKEPFASSTYKAHFPGHGLIKPQVAAQSDDSSTLSAATKGQRFGGSSSYNNDYASPRSISTHFKSAGVSGGQSAPMNDNMSTLTDMVAECPFVGESSYKQHFIRHRDTGTQASAKPEHSAMEVKTFEGKSEYRRQYEQRGGRPQLLNFVLA